MGFKNRPFNTIKDFISYDKESGVFLVIKKANKFSHEIGSNAGSKRKDGYTFVGFGGKRYAAHRLAWYYVYGEMPKGYVDHINGNPEDNRIVNLRDVSHRENLQNTKSHRQGKLVGCSHNKALNRWESRARFGKKVVRIGNFATEKEASDAYFEVIKHPERINKYRKRKEYLINVESFLRESVKRW